MRLWPKSSRCALRFLILILFLGEHESPAQTTSSGALTGVVTDQTNAVIANAQLEIKDAAKGLVQTTNTDREGTYHFFFVTPGKYILTVGHAGFREEHRTVNVLLGPPITVNIMLAIAQATSEITVADEVPLIQAENGDASATVSQVQISELPNPGMAESAAADPPVPLR